MARNMTDEEKAESYTYKHLPKGLFDFELFKKMKEVIIKAYLDGLAEGRKETTEKISALEKENEQLIEEIAEHKEVIAKQRCCGNCKHWNHEGIQKYCVLTKPDFLIKRQKDICDKWEMIE